MYSILEKELAGPSRNSKQMSIRNVRKTMAMRRTTMRKSMATTKKSVKRSIINSKIKNVDGVVQEFYYNNFQG